MGLLGHLSEEQLALFTDIPKALRLGVNHLSGARPECRPRWHEVDRLELKQVRLLAQVVQESVVLHVGTKGQPLMLIRCCGSGGEFYKSLERIWKK